MDLQHGLGSYDGLPAVLTALGRVGPTPLVRVPSNQTDHIGKALDAGAEGVVVPMVSSRAEAERAVAAARYAPEGHRSFGPVRSGMFLNERPPAEVNREVLCLIMIETIEGVERAEKICATPGVDGVYLGPADLAITMGLAPGFGAMSAEHGEAIDHVRRCCAAQGIVPGIHTGGGLEARGYLEAGFMMTTVATDAALMRTACAREMAIARGEDPAAGGRGPPATPG